MNTPLRKTHPMLLVAAGAVTLASLTATATLLGWLPSSQATAPQTLATSLGAQATSESNSPAVPTPNVIQAPARHEVAPPKAHKIVKVQAEPSRNTPAPSPATPPAAPVALAEAPRSAPLPAPPVCENCGRIEAMRDIRRPGEGSGLGAVGGALAGGLVGNQIGKGKGNQLATLLGLVGGAMAGHQVEKNARAEHDTEVVVRMDDGSTRTLLHDGTPVWRSGDRVRIVNGQLQTL